ncbi:MAG: hypothetical protein R3C61_28625 [Bacteroidia bacterium]
MTPALRKRHFFSWVVLAIAVPLGFYLAILAIPPIPRNPDIPRLVAKPLEELVRQSETYPSGVSATLRSQTRSMVESGTDNGLPEMKDTSFQVEISVSQPFRAPSVLVYLSLTPGSKSVDGRLLLGRLDTTGEYRFNLDQLSAAPEAMYLIFYDDFHDKILEEIKL